MIPEAAALHRELHAAHAKLDGNRNINECFLSALKSTRPEAVESKVG